MPCSGSVGAASARGAGLGYLLLDEPRPVATTAMEKLKWSARWPAVFPLYDGFMAGRGETQGEFELSMAGVNSGYPRLEIGSRWGSSLAAVAVDNL